jgi:hypothetical protein
VGDQTILVKPHQIIVWLSISPADMVEWDPRTPAFPAILDSGNNFTLSIFTSQLMQWAGIRPELLRVLGRIREGGRHYPRHEADVWLHPNVPGTRERQAGSRPCRLTLEKGLAVYPDSVSLPPHLPLLGLQALTENELHLTVDGAQQLVWLRTLDWRTRLLRWLS